MRLLLFLHLHHALLLLEEEEEGVEDEGNICACDGATFPLRITIVMMMMAATTTRILAEVKMTSTSLYLESWSGVA